MRSPAATDGGAGLSKPTGQEEVGLAHSLTSPALATTARVMLQQRRTFGMPLQGHNGTSFKFALAQAVSATGHIVVRGPL